MVTFDPRPPVCLRMTWSSRGTEVRASDIKSLFPSKSLQSCIIQKVFFSHVNDDISRQEPNTVVCSSSPWVARPRHIWKQRLFFCETFETGDYHQEKISVAARLGERESEGVTEGGWEAERE